MKKENKNKDWENPAGMPFEVWSKWVDSIIKINK